MSLKSKLETLERKLPEKKTENDPVYPYVITAEYFEYICRELHATFEPAPNLEKLRQQHSSKQALDIWMCHYSYYDSGVLKVPPPEFIAEYDSFASMSLSDWYRSVFAEILEFPHRIEFDPVKFGLVDR